MKLKIKLINRFVLLRIYQCFTCVMKLKMDMVTKKLDIHTCILTNYLINLYFTCSENTGYHSDCFIIYIYVIISGIINIDILVKTILYNNITLLHFYIYNIILYLLIIRHINKHNKY